MRQFPIFCTLSLYFASCCLARDQARSKRRSRMLGPECSGVASSDVRRRFALARRKLPALAGNG